MSVSKLTAIIKADQARGRLTPVPYLPAAFPTADRFWNVLAELDASGAGIIEIGIPFSDPVADGPVVAAASQAALENGGGLKYIFDGLASRRGSLKCGLVLMGYVNPFMQYGLDEAGGYAPGVTVQQAISASLDILAARLNEAGISGLIVPDLPLEESGPWIAALKKYGLDLIPLVGPNTAPERMKLYAESGMGGYVYVVSVMGTTGVREGLPPEVTGTLLRARQVFDLPLALGFGLKSPKQLASLEEKIRPDAAVFGSALIRHLEDGGKVEDFMAPWQN